MGEKKNAYVLFFIDLIVQERVCISRQQDEDAKGKIAARTRRQNAGKGGWTPWKQNAEDRRCARPIGLLGETSVSKSNMPTTCAESANSTHITLEDGSWCSDTISNSQRTQDLYKWHHNFPQSISVGRCSHSVSTTTKIVITQDSGRDRIYTGWFSYLPARDKRGSPSWLYHSTLSQLPEDIRQKTREFAWFLHESAASHFRKMLTNK